MGSLFPRPIVASPRIFVVFNANRVAATVALPPGRWRVVVTGTKVDLAAQKTVEGGDLAVPALSSWILHRE